MKFERVIAVDWSGRRGPDQANTIWLAEIAGGRLTRLECGRTRVQVVEHLIELARDDPRLVVGFDFAFSVPEWYLRQLGLATAHELWALLAEESLTPKMKQLGLAAWMNDPEPPYWTAGSGHLSPAQMFRRTEDEARACGSQPKSVFQLVGGGQVGRSSLYGMQALHELRAAGFSIWPFDPPREPLIVEIFPRLLTGPVRKSQAPAREHYVTTWNLDPLVAARAASTEDAFDACVSALVMSSSRAELEELVHEREYALEGKIWHPRANGHGRKSV